MFLNIDGFIVKKKKKDIRCELRQSYDCVSVLGLIL